MRCILGKHLPHVCSNDALQIMCWCVSMDLLMSFHPGVVLTHSPGAAGGPHGEGRVLRDPVEAGKLPVFSLNFYVLCFEALCVCSGWLNL